MTGIVIQSKQEMKEVQTLLSKQMPHYRQAYSDRTAWVMACISELAYIRFNPLIEGFKTDKLIEKITSVDTKSSGIGKIRDILKTFSYDHEQEERVLKNELDQLNYKLVKTFDSDGTQAILIENDKHIVLAFRGTESNSIKDIKADAKAIAKKDSSGGKIHSGFEEAYQKVAFSIEKALDAPDLKEKPLFITGHSLGGALATIAAKKLSHTGGNSACYTFGAPRVGDANWVSNIKTPLYRVVNAADCVTMLPPSSETITLMGWVLGLIPNIGSQVRSWLLDKFDGYIHGGNMRYLTNCTAGDYDKVKLLYSVSWFYRIKALFIKKLSYKKPLSDHAISTYRKKLFIVAKTRNQQTDYSHASGASGVDATPEPQGYPT